MTETLVRESIQTITPASETSPKAKGRVVFDAHWCRTCRVCEVVCSIAKEGQAWPAVARINILFNEFASIDPISATICFQCEDAPCIAACRVGAMTRDARTGAVVILQDKCVGCMRCQKACQWGIPKQHPDRRQALKCDLCSDREGGPLCVEMCPLSGKALKYEPDYYTRGNGDGRV